MLDFLISSLFWSTITPRRLVALAGGEDAADRFCARRRDFHRRFLRTFFVVLVGGYVGIFVDPSVTRQQRLIAGEVVFNAAFVFGYVAGLVGMLEGQGSASAVTIRRALVDRRAWTSERPSSTGVAPSASYA